MHNQRNNLSPPEYQAQIQQVEHICDWLIKRTLAQPDKKRLLERYRKYRDCLCVALQRTDVIPTNNASERYLRPAVIHRKIIGCFRSGWGAGAYSALASVIGTAALNGISSFNAIQNLFRQASSPASFRGVSSYIQPGKPPCCPLLPPLLMERGGHGWNELMRIFDRWKRGCFVVTRQERGTSILGSPSTTYKAAS